jgi:hypothetical protein
VGSVSVLSDGDVWIMVLSWETDLEWRGVVPIGKRFLCPIFPKSLSQSKPVGGEEVIFSE